MTQEREITIDETDLEILKLLQKDARLSYRSIAEKLQIAAGTVHNRVKKLQEEGIIKGFSVVVNHEKLGYQLTALILARVSGGKLLEVQEQIAQHEQVMCVYDITGQYDMAILARFTSRKDLDKFIKSVLVMPYIERTNTSIVLNICKERWTPANL